MKSISIFNKVKNTLSLKQNYDTCYSFNDTWISYNGIQQ
ncbi:hypothetical protein SAMN04489757_10293 [Anaerocolumna aminovalerica]|uniref:Uncharacterized protein n=1 Tax=Anaerocolumna aminovalerica TaxID=1527 RepID=A0A1I5C2X4_9FIRM|nr:hypothetical protein SAMN04489757_10293 [Anaerocolumna aminovalerica]